MKDAAKAALAIAALFLTLLAITAIGGWALHTVAGVPMKMVFGYVYTDQLVGFLIVASMVGAITAIAYSASPNIRHKIKAFFTAY